MAFWALFRILGVKSTNGLAASKDGKAQLFPVLGDPPEQRPSQDRVQKRFRRSVLEKKGLAESPSRVQKTTPPAGEGARRRPAGERSHTRSATARSQQPAARVTIAARPLPSSSASSLSPRPRRVSKCSLGEPGPRPVPIGRSPSPAPIGCFRKRDGYAAL